MPYWTKNKAVSAVMMMIVGNFGVHERLLLRDDIVAPSLAGGRRYPHLNFYFREASR